MITPMQLPIFQNQTVVLKCNANASNTLLYQWFFNGTKKLQEETELLTLNKIQPYNKGTYHCVCELADVVKSSTQIDVSVICKFYTIF